MLGDAVFDTTRTFGGEIFRLDEHLDRFLNSLKYMRMEPNLSKNEWQDLTMKILELNLPLLDKNDDYWVSQRVSRGDGKNYTVIVESLPLPFEQRAKYYKDGLPTIVPSVMGRMLGAPKVTRTWQTMCGFMVAQQSRLLPQLRLDVRA